jgi:hypothetical protein
VIKAQPKAVGDVQLYAVHLGAEFRNRLFSLGRSQLGRGAVFICGTQEHHFIPPATLITCVKIRWQLRADQVAEVFDPVDVGDRRSDKNPSHFLYPRICLRARLPYVTGQQKPARRMDVTFAPYQQKKDEEAGIRIVSDMFVAITTG